MLVNEPPFSDSSPPLFLNAFLSSLVGDADLARLPFRAPLGGIKLGARVGVTVLANLVVAVFLLLSTVSPVQSGPSSGMWSRCMSKVSLPKYGVSVDVEGSAAVFAFVGKLSGVIDF